MEQPRKYPTVCCHSCGDIIQTTSLHDFVVCKCETSMLDGGPNGAYIRMNIDQAPYTWEPLTEATRRRLGHPSRS